MDVDAHDTATWGEPGSEFRVFIDGQAPAMPVLADEIEEGFLLVVNGDDSRMAISFQPKPEGGITAWVRGFSVDTLMTPEVTDFEGVVKIDV